MTLPQNKSVLIAVGIALAISLWLISGLFKPEEVKVAKSVTETHKITTTKVLVKSDKAIDHADILNLYGKTKADRSVVLKAETTGRINEVLIEKGAQVKKGDVIARIAMDDRQSRLKSAKALVRQRELEFEASRKLSQKSFRSKTTLAENEAALHAARADLENTRLDIAHTEIKAPFDGKLETRDIEVGDFVENGTALASVVDLSPIIITADIPESKINRIRDGQPAQAILNDTDVIQGIVRYVASTSNEETRTYRVEIEATDPNLSVAIGQTALVRLQMSVERAYRVSPSILTLADTGEIGVKTVNGKDQVQFNKISILEDTAEGIWISGLPDNARIIMRGQEYVKPGQTVIPVENEAELNKKNPVAPALAKAEGSE